MAGESHVARLRRPSAVSFASAEPLRPLFHRVLPGRDRLSAPAAGSPDYLHPEWANAAFHHRRRCRSPASATARRVAGNRRSSATGPTSQAIHFGVGPTRIWGVGPAAAGLGEVRRCAGRAPRRPHWSTATAHAAFAGFTPLADDICSAPGAARGGTRAAITAHFLDQPRSARCPTRRASSPATRR